jgi:hypothetical protein
MKAGARVFSEGVFFQKDLGKMIGRTSSAWKEHMHFLEVSLIVP